MRLIFIIGFIDPDHEFTPSVARPCRGTIPAMHLHSEHTFHIPVLGLSYSVDTPLKVARFGISSVVSIIKDDLLETMRRHYTAQFHLPFESIPESDPDYRAKRITAYLDMVQVIVKMQISRLRMLPFEPGNELATYFELLPEQAPSRLLYNRMQEAEGREKRMMQEELRERVVPGSVDVNIMTKIDNLKYTKDHEALPPEYADAMSALRGFAKSGLQSSVVFSAGLNPRLFAYLESFDDFFPDASGVQKKQIILKVSDFRSAMIQGRLLAKRGVWISEFRIESGLNCGGHAFPTEGFLMGPILEEFRLRRHELAAELFTVCNQALDAKGWPRYQRQPENRITVQGGIGTSSENRLLREWFEADATGWGSPFLLVPEATSVDEHTLHDMAQAQPGDYFLSQASPLGVPFNNFRKSTAEAQRLDRIAKHKPGSPCYHKHLAFDTEFTKEPICQASRKYQRLKLKQLEDMHLDPAEHASRFQEITSKDCLCEGLSTSVLLLNHIPVPAHRKAVTICPGPNLAYFSGIFSLRQMVSHIYGRINILNNRYRPHFFINECGMYIDYLKKEVQKTGQPFTDKQLKYFTAFKSNLLDGLTFYEKQIGNWSQYLSEGQQRMAEELREFRERLMEITFHQMAPVPVTQG